MEIFIVQHSESVGRDDGDEVTSLGFFSSYRKALEFSKKILHNTTGAGRVIAGVQIDNFIYDELHIVLEELDTPSKWFNHIITLVNEKTIEQWNEVRYSQNARDSEEFQIRLAKIAVE